MSGITIEQFREIVRTSLPFAEVIGAEVAAMGEGRATVRMPFKADFLRPGGTISGPMLMGLADFAIYAALLSAIGPVELAVTTSLTINFLRKPPPAAVLAEARMLKVGRRLGVGEVELFTEGDDDMVAHVVATYSIPPS